MSANLSVEQSLMKAKSHVKKGDLAEAQKLYETILQNISNNIRTQKEIGALNNPVGPLIDMYNKNTWETWDNVFRLIKEDILKLNQN